MDRITTIVMSSKGMLYNIKHKCYYAMHSYIGLGSGAPMAMGTKLKYYASQRLNMLKNFTIYEAMK